MKLGKSPKGQRQGKGESRQYWRSHASQFSVTPLRDKQYYDADTVIGNIPRKWIQS